MRLILLLVCINFAMFSQEIKIATYNVENLFDGVRQGTEYREFKNFKLANMKFNHTVKAVKSIHADIIAVQEVENKSILRRLARRAKFPYIAFSKPYKSPVGLGVMSKYPIVFSKDVKPGIKKTRNFLYADIDIKGYKLGIWVVHFPTQKYKKNKRLKVARALKKAVEDTKNKEFIIVGDFNTKLFKKSILKQTFGSLDDKNSFYDAWLTLPYNKRYSQVFYGKKSALDRMILPKSMFDKKGFDFKENSFKVVKNNFLSDERGNPRRWNTRYSNQKGYSDHFPLILSVTTDFNEQQKIKSKEVTIDELLKMQIGKKNVVLKKVKVSKKTKHGIFLSKNGKKIFVYKSGIGLNVGDIIDVRVKYLDKYKKYKEITLMEVVKKYER